MAERKNESPLMAAVLVAPFGDIVACGTMGRNAELVATWIGLASCCLMVSCGDAVEIRSEADNGFIDDDDDDDDEDVDEDDDGAGTGGVSWETAGS
nr:unnamed protein product [Haemonchus contortus]